MEEESGPAAFGKAGGNSRHWAAAGFPKRMLFWECSTFVSRTETWSIRSRSAVVELSRRERHGRSRPRMLSGGR